MAKVTIEDIRKLKKEFDGEGLSSRPTFTKQIGYIGGGLYRISDQCLTNRNGWNEFCNSIQKEGIKILNELKDKKP